MPPLSKIPPSSLRPESTSPRAQATRSGDQRPYLVQGSYRRAEIIASRGIATHQQTIALFPHESEDARLTGSTRSLFRRLLALNLPAGLSYSETALTVEVSSKSASADEAREKANRKFIA